MSETEYQLIKSVGFVLGLGIVSGLQRWRAHSGAAGSWRINATLWAVNAGLLGAVCGACACVASRWAASEEVGVLNAAALSGVLAMAISVLLLDAVSYWWHRANHVLALLWRFHQAHHSDSTFTASTALRFHPGELLLALPVRLAAVVGFGIPIEGLIAFEVWFAFSNFFEHGDIRLPLRLEDRISRLFVTPALHRRHHSRKRELLNSNYGTIFTFWDRLFGTFGPSDSDTPVNVGLPRSTRTTGCTTRPRPTGPRALLGRGAVAWQQTPDDRAAGAALLEHFPESGVYYMPGNDHEPELRSQLFEQGPTGFVILDRDGRPAFDTNIMIAGLALNGIVVSLLALLLRITLPAAPSYGRRIRIVAVAGAAGVLLINFGDVVWWAIPTPWVLAQAVYNFLGVMIAGAILARFIAPGSTLNA